MSKAHIANIRLLVSEGPRVPEITHTFYAMGPRRTKSRLNRFFRERFRIDDAEFEVDIFLAVLLSLRTPVLTGLNTPASPAEIRRHAAKAVKVLLKLLERQKG